MRDLAARIGISDVGLKKLLHASGIVTPPQGYWNKLKAGKPVPTRPKPPERRPGENGRTRLDERFAGHISEAGRMAEKGPFASKFVPEDLAELRTLELKALGKITVPRAVERFHPGLTPILKKEERRASKDGRV
jgi:hypothetical protein